MSNHAGQPGTGPDPTEESGGGVVDSPTASNRSLEHIDWLSFGLTTVVLLVLYSGTLAPEVTLQFSGELSTSAGYAGVAHPPGFPVWTLYSWVFVELLPFGNVAVKAALGSAFATALACGVVALIVSSGGAAILRCNPATAFWKAGDQKLLRLICGYVGGMALGLSRVVWQKAVIVDVWALSTVLFSTMLCLCLGWMARPEKKRSLYGAGLVFGLLLTSNQELLVTVPALLLLVMLTDEGLGRDLSLPVACLAVVGGLANAVGLFPGFGYHLPGWYLVVDNMWLLAAFLLIGGGAVLLIVRTRRFGSEWKPAVLCAVVLSAGFGFCLFLPVASMTNPPMNWSYPRTTEGFVHLITRGQYDRPHPTEGLGRLLLQVWMLLKQTGQGLGWPYLVLGLVPFCAWRRIDPIIRKWLWGLSALGVCLGPIVVASLNPALDTASMHFIEPYFAVLYLLVAVCSGLGLVVIGGIIAKPGVPRKA
ncbi:MAG TPA: DUF2723 domain-containing protein [Verrucomicrobiae bacterium]